MSEYGGASEEPAPHAVSPISVLWVIVASVISAAGLLVLWVAVTDLDWVYFVLGPLVVLVGVLMFLNDRAGLDHA
ncbi:MAG: hypothetical protein ACRECT_07860 [Thermoplasmata archaeon]